VASRTRARGINPRRSFDSALHQVVDGAGARRRATALLPVETGRKTGPELMLASSAHVRSARTRQRAGLGPMGGTTSSGSVPSWLALCS
jgi:hypothetical protein